MECPTCGSRTEVYRTLTDPNLPSVKMRERHCTNPECREAMRTGESVMQLLPQVAEERYLGKKTDTRDLRRFVHDESSKIMGVIEPLSAENDAKQPENTEKAQENEPKTPESPKKQRKNEQKPLILSGKQEILQGEQSGDRIEVSQT